MHLTPTRGAPGTVITFTTVINLAIDFSIETHDGCAHDQGKLFPFGLLLSPLSWYTLGRDPALGQLVARSWADFRYT